MHTDAVLNFKKILQYLYLFKKYVKMETSIYLEVNFVGL